jgi:hypothetical protein
MNLFEKFPKVFQARADPQDNGPVSCVREADFGSLTLSMP